ncbi:L-aspartate oxidase [Nocardia flavorosea]|uniref:L-aspartate oxidase n=1 Tax=Nocardia flavorosea TaxID=53429 RepID=A0A846YMH3_9NOCA|nr:L-aspartate oxidase [Nocardia flavorosea]NKY58672.1 L-aspartate oxidase [Nocardia flavorosea]
MTGEPWNPAWEERADLVVIGGGVAGLTAARAASRRGLRVLILSKGGPSDTATQYAQGGIAVVAPQGDSVDSHVADTLAAGGGLCDPAAVRSIVEAGPDAVAALTDLGAVFDLGRDGQISRTREGGHSTRRIIHAGGDATGAEVQRALSAAGLPVLFGTAVLDVVTDESGVQGVVAVSGRGTGVVHAPAVLLATGGLGQLYALSTNPAGATADGVALALWAGAAVADLEFVQFHPTVLYSPGGLGRQPLISEAVRGEGAVLVDSRGDSVTAGVHPRGDLAPRDVVSRAIAARLRELGEDHVYLDARAVPDFTVRFPTITTSCRVAGIDPRRDLIPVAPAAHYQCGGVVTDLHGRTGVPGLYAAGEVARTGLHGANRLASNSLLEGLVMGERAGLAALERLGEPAFVSGRCFVDRPALPRALVQRTMTEHASVVRDGRGLAQATAVLEAAIGRDARLPAGSVEEESPVIVPMSPESSSASIAGRSPVSPAEVIARFEGSALTVTARAVLLAAAARTESRGCHTRAEQPVPQGDSAEATVVCLDGSGAPYLAATAVGSPDVVVHGPGVPTHAGGGTGPADVPEGMRHRVPDDPVLRCRGAGDVGPATGAASIRGLPAAMPDAGIPAGATAGTGPAEAPS